MTSSPIKCKHLHLNIDIEERLFFDIGVSEVCNKPGFYTCTDCGEPVFHVDGKWLTKKELDAHNKDVDSIPF